MIEFTFTPEMVKEAQKEAEQLGALKNSITKGAGNIIGILGEIAVANATGSKRANTKDYDVLRPDGKTSDVKSKKCSGPPEPHFECSVADFNTSQKCDYYVFVRVHKDLTKAWIVGELPKTEYFEKAVFIQQGQFDPANNWRCKADCYNVAISELNEVVAA
jgi:hypothetical protein